MNSINDRIFILRNELGLSMEKFGLGIGVTKSSINKLEKGDNNPSERTLKLICSAYNVNYYWLTKGLGEMFTAIPDTIIDEVVDEFNLDKNDRFIIESYLELKEDDRAAVKKFLLNFVDKIKKDEN